MKVRLKRVKHGDRSTRCLFFEITGREDCPFHHIKKAIGVTIVGPILLYAAKRTKLGTRGSYKRKRKTRRKK